MNTTTDEPTESLLNCPVGCAFLLTIARDKIPVARAVAPGEAFARATAALRALNPWSGNFDHAIAASLARASTLTSLARDVTTHPGSRWWTPPLHRTGQVLVSESTPYFTAENAPYPDSLARWSAYAQRPANGRFTSTLRGSYSCLDTAIATGAGDWLEPQEYRRHAVAVTESARVLEIAGPADWHALCVSYPSPNQDATSPAGAGSLSPDWGRVAVDWDGVHLSFMGLLTAPFVRNSSAAGTSMLWSWDAECTLWLPGDLRAESTLLPTVHRSAVAFCPDTPLTADELDIPD